MTEALNQLKHQLNHQLPRRPAIIPGVIFQGATLFWQNQTSLGHVWQGLPIGLGAHLFSQLLWSLLGAFQGDSTKFKSWTMNKLPKFYWTNHSPTWNSLSGLGIITRNLTIIYRDMVVSRYDLQYISQMILPRNMGYQSVSATKLDIWNLGSLLQTWTSSSHCWIHHILSAHKHT